MNKSHFTTSVSIQASPESVWQALTDPQKTAQYMYGSQVRSSWEQGTPIQYTMEKDGQEFTVVHGRIIECRSPQLLKHTLFPTTWADMEDIPENHLIIEYRIQAGEDGHTELSITQTGFDTAAEGAKRYEDTVKGWAMTLPNLKAVAEKG